MAYLHGSETTEIDVAGRPFSVVLSSVAGFVGIAPKGPVNALTLVTSPANAIEVFGAEVPGYSLPEALAAYFAEGGGVVLCVNVFDAATNTAIVTAEAVTVTAGRLALAAAPYGSLAITNAAGSTTLVLDTDYRVNAYGVVTILNRSVSGGYPDGTALKASYTKLAPATVTSTQIIGGNDGVSRTGSFLFELAYSNFGFNAKILAAPGYSTFASVAARLQLLAKKYRGVALLDAPMGTSLTAVLAGRGIVAPVGGFDSQSERTYLLYPHVKRSDPATPATPGNPDPVKLVPYSAVMAGIISATDLTLGFHYSPSNKVMQGVRGLEISLSAAINDPTTDIQVLNSQGITTIFAGYGTGFRSWGNRSAAFPVSAAVSTFLSVRRTADVIEETIELNYLPFADLPTNLATIDAVRQAVNAFLSSLVQRGAIIDGTCEFLAEDNPISQLAEGFPVFSYNFLPPPPMERARFKARLDVSLLKKLVS